LLVDTVTGNEQKLRLFETSGVSILPADARLLLDGPTTGPANANTPTLFSDGMARTLEAAVPSNFPPSTPAKIPLKVGDAVNLYDLASIVAGRASFYLGPFQFPPSVNNQGLALVPGNTYFNTTNNTDYVFNTSNQWVPIGSGAPAVLKAYYYFPTVNVNQIPINGPGTVDSRGNVLAFNIAAGVSSFDAIQVLYNGVQLISNVDYVLHEGSTGAGDYISLNFVACGGASLVVQQFGQSGTLFASQAVSVDTRTWIFNGTNRTFPMKDYSAQNVAPVSTANCLLCLSGRVLNPTSEFTVSGTNITFTTAPSPADSVFLTVGLPISGGATLMMRGLSEVGFTHDTTNLETRALLARIAAMEATVQSLVDARNGEQA
jgi:hypothetical protein